MPASNGHETHSKTNGTGGDVQTNGNGGDDHTNGKGGVIHTNGAPDHACTINDNSNATVEVPVLIVGGGPTGLLLAHLLSKLRVKSLLIEKYPERLGAPKAHALCPRSLEICRQFGLDSRQLRQLGTKRADAYWVNFLTDLSGEQIGVLPYERMDPATMDSTPEMIHNIPQPVFEQFVAEVLKKDPNVETRQGAAFVSCVQDDTGVTSLIQERATQRQYHVRSRHVIACDGAKSQVRKSLGIESDGEDSYETMMTIHFNADLRPLTKGRPGMLHWITDPAASGFIIGYDLSGNQVLISNFDSAKHPVETWSKDLCRQVVIAALGQEIPFDVLSYRPWILSRKVAKVWNVGNVFLAGDAAHSFPPTGGLGLNSGIADVHNIAYKIAGVHKGWASPELLKSYADERKIVAEIASTQSVKNGKKIFSFLKALGTAGIDDPGEARRVLHKTIHDPSKQKLIADEVENQREHFDNMELHIGYVYGSKELPPNASIYTPKFVVGARLPHAWIRFPDDSLKPATNSADLSYIHEMSPSEIQDRKYSTLDLCAFDGFTLIVGCRDLWLERFRALAAAMEPRGLKLALHAADSDFEFVFPQGKLLFDNGAHFANGGGLFVRPDQHILKTLPLEVTVEELRTELTQHLGL